MMKTSLKIFFSALVALPLLAPTFGWASDAKTRAEAEENSAYARVRAAQDAANAKVANRMYIAMKKFQIEQCAFNAQANVTECNEEYSCNYNEPIWSDLDPDEDTGNENTDCDDKWYGKCLWAAALLSDWCNKWDVDEDIIHYDLSDKCMIGITLGLNKCVQSFDKGSAEFFDCKLVVHSGFAACEAANFL